MSNIRVCKSCNSSDIDTDRARGITACVNCGTVLEESIIVSEVQIEEGAGGGMNVVGQFVGSNDTRGITIHGLQHSFRESREVTLQNGKRLINEMSSQLRLNQHCIDTAFNFYKLAVQRGLTRGRKIRQVIAACIYLVCRTEGTPHMLLDLCDIVHDDACYISSLGKLAMKFAYLLRINLPQIDPGLFIPRFAQKLEFGEKTHDVTYTALRLVERMDHDWMATGRRPSGLCGAALIVSARMYGFERSLDDIVKVVKIGKTTLRKRMLEFEDTPSSNLTVDEFHTIDLEEQHDPPAFTRSKKFAKIKQIEEMANIEDIEKEIIALQDKIENALSDLNKPRGIMAKYAKLTQFEDEILGPNKDLTNIDTEIKETEEFLSEDQITLIRSIVVDSSLKVIPDKLTPTLRSLGFVQPTTSSNNIDILNTDEEELSSDENSEEEFDSDDFDNDDEIDSEVDNEDKDIDLNSIQRRKRRRKLRRLQRKRLALEHSQNITPNNNKSPEVQNPVIKDLSTSTTSIPMRSNSINETISKEPVIDVNAESLNNTNEQCAATSSKSNEETPSEKTKEKSDELDLTGIDDDEIDTMLLSKDEIRTKAKLWLRANKDWLKEQKDKDDQKKKEKEENKGIEQKPKKTRNRKPKNMTPVANPQEAIERMLQEKKLSSKINYDVLKNLGKDLKKT